ncbi:enoyl-CoA hydratase/isomerase family protein [Phycicoccus sp. Soil748]|uniref:enoyl-CoA hydratase/isomerase family protein n=1 Tax=Phycicoccus sp. Soil748 TaxID=1736397 RepID=UPI001F392840|nr:enoyl-CoA hydratase/isomerase family protein [Phycicoccus sp. Soil748]
MTGHEWWDGEYEDLQVRAHEASGRRVAVVTLDLPERRNSMSGPMTASWVEVMRLLRADGDLAAVVVTGAAPAFCAGGDLTWLVSDPDASVPDLRTRMLAFYRSWLAVRDLEVPTIAAVNGAAIGAGMALALACDLRYVASDARLGVPFTALGLHPGMATTWSLPDVAGSAVARDLLLTGRLVTGTEAVQLGLASRALPADAVLDESLAAAERIAAAAPVATRLTLQALRSGGHADHETALQWEALAQATTLATEDVQEGIAAAAARRTPQFRGR